jgi:AcrR family transcriptional regulator
MGTSLSQESPGKRHQNKLRNRLVILDAARKVFVEIGYDAASVRDIVAGTDLAPGTFYNYFPDKRSVLLALTEQAAREAGVRIREARARASSLEELAESGFRAYFEFIAGDRTMFELMRRNVSTLRALGVDETGFAEGVADLRADLEARIQSGLLPPLPMQYLPQSIAAIAFEVGAAMVRTHPPDVAGATRFAAALCLGGLQRLSSGERGAPDQFRARSEPRARANKLKRPSRERTKT